MFFCHRIQDLQSTRQQDRQNFQTIERRLGDERRQKQALESQLSNERKYRKLAEEKVARAECSEACKLKAKQMELELNKLRRELAQAVDAKHNAEKQSRNFEHEVSRTGAFLFNGIIYERDFVIPVAQVRTRSP